MGSNELVGQFLLNITTYTSTKVNVMFAHVQLHLNTQSIMHIICAVKESSFSSNVRKTQHAELVVKFLKCSVNTHLMCVTRVVAKVDLQRADLTDTCGWECVETLRGIHASSGGLRT